MRPVDQRRRAELIDATLEYLGRRGLDNFSLRGLAAELGTTARMLVHYFGSRDELINQAFAAHRRRMLDGVRRLAVDDLAGAARASWRTMTAAEHRGHYTVMFQIMTASLAEGHPYREVARRSVLDWIDETARLLVTRGRDERTARTEATVLVSGLKGIVLDLLVTGDRERCEAAAAAFVTRLAGDCSSSSADGVSAVVGGAGAKMTG
jgi:AcrR family transcriptional regulator